MIKKLFPLIAAALLLAACHKDEPSNGNDKPLPNPYEITGAKATLDPSTTFQTWEGFGAMNLGGNWGDAIDWSDSETDTFTESLGLNIMRIRIPYDENDWSKLVNGCRYAYQNHGTLILASPWTMPVTMKTPEQAEALKDGKTSSLRPDKYGDYAAYLQRFVNYMSNAGAPLYAISVQNEPDWHASYEGCMWTAQQHLDFVKNYGQSITGTLLMTGESMGSDHSFYTPVLNDDAACANIDIVGGHLYGTTPQPFPLAEQKGKSLWMTEHLLNDSFAKGTSVWLETMDMAKEIAGCLNSGWNAYIWWYGIRYYSLLGDGDAGTTRGAILPRGRAFAQFSRYIRPGDRRIAISIEGAEGLSATAFKGENGRITIVIVNPGQEIYKDFTIETGGTFSKISGSYTDPNLPADLKFTSSDGKIILNLNSASVTTIVANP